MPIVEPRAAPLARHEYLIGHAFFVAMEMIERRPWVGPVTVRDIAVASGSGIEMAEQVVATLARWGWIKESERGALTAQQAKNGRGKG